MSIRFNPLIFGGFDLTGGGGGPAGAVQWKSPVADEASLPLVGNAPGDARVVLDTDKIYVWDDATSKWIDSKLTTAAFGATPNADGITISSVTVGNITSSTINLEPADSTNPGAVSTSAQTFAGDKTFNDDIIVEGSIDAKGGIDSSTNTLTIGATADNINIGAPGATVFVQSDVLYVADKNITINYGGAAASGSDAGIEIEENLAITGFVKVTPDRNSWELKAPNQAGVATIDAGAAGITIDQSSHDPVTLSAVGSSPNSDGATLSGQVLNLEPADSTNPGVVSTTSQNFAGDKTFDNLVTASSGVETDSIDSITAGAGTLSIGTANASIINIGDSGVNVNLYGNTFYQDVTNLEVTDKQITLNKNGAVNSAFNSGIELEENGSITGYVSTSGDRNSWELKAPNQAGVATISPGASGITLDQSSHDPVTLGAVGSTPNINAATLTGQVLNLEPADAVNAGLITATAQTFGGDKTFNDDVIVVGNIDAQGGVDSSGASLDIGANSTQINVYAQTDFQSGAISNVGTLTTSATTTDGVIASLYINNSPDFSALGFSSNNPGSAELLYSDGGVLSVNASGSLTLDSPDINIGQSPGTTDIIGTVTIEYNPANPTDWAPAPDDVIEGLDQIANRFVSQNQVTKEPTGFPNRDDSVTSFSDTSPARTFTIAPTGASFDFYVKGAKFTKTTTQSIQIPNLAGNHYIYFNDSGTLSSTQILGSELFENNALVSIVYWNTDTNSRSYFAEERHGLTMDGATHTYLHTVFGARYLSGLALQNFSVDGTGNLAANAQFDADEGKIRDEDILIEILPQAQIPILYRQGQLWRKKPADAYPVIYSGTAGYTGTNGRLPYNQFTGGSWQFTQVTNNDYVLVHFFATNDKDSPVVGIQGINQYNNITDARNAASTEITSLSGLPFAEFVALGSVVFETANGYTNIPQARIRSVNGGDYVDFRGTQLYTPAGEATTHSLLSGLGNDDHIQYLLASGTRTMSGALNMGTHQINNVVDPTSAQDAATKNYVDGKVADSITDGVTTIAPSQNAVFDALALKADDSVVVKSVNGVLPVANAVTIDTDDVSEGTTNVYFTDGRAQTAVITQTITNGVTDKSPSEDAVFDALALKQDVGNYITALTGEVTASGPGSVAATIAANAVTNAKLAQMSASTLKGNNTGSTANASDLSVTDVRTLLSIIPASSGDIPRTSFTADDNQSSAANITSFVFANAVTRGFEAIVTIERSSTYAEYTLKGIQKSASWEMSQDYIGDDSGIVFSITSAGQIQYTSTNTGSSATIKFRASTV
jgi:hypothetical protein